MLKNNAVLSAILKFRYRLKLRSRLADLGISYIPGEKLVKGILDSSNEKARQILVSCLGCKMYVDPADVGIVPYLLSDGIYERRTTELFQELLKPGMVVLDIGANFGYYALIASRYVGNTGKIYALEPEPNNFRLLVENIKINNFSNIVPLQMALSSENGIATLFLDKANCGAHSIRQGNVLIDGGVAQVETTTLDSFVERNVENKNVDLIIMDVQGAEGLVFDGADQFLKTNNVKILMEFWPWGLRNFGTDPQSLIQKLYDYGFAIEPIGDIGQPSDLAALSKKLEAGPDKQAAVNLLLTKNKSISSETLSN